MFKEGLKLFKHYSKNIQTWICKVLLKGLYLVTLALIYRIGNSFNTRWQFNLIWGNNRLPYTEPFFLSSLCRKIFHHLCCLHSARVSASNTDVHRLKSVKKREEGRSICVSTPPWRRRTSQRWVKKDYTGDWICIRGVVNPTGLLNLRA